MALRKLRRIRSLKSIVARKRKRSRYADYASLRPGRPIAQPRVIAGAVVAGRSSAGKANGR